MTVLKLTFCVTIVGRIIPPRLYLVKKNKLERLVKLSQCQIFTCLSGQPWSHCSNMKGSTVQFSMDSNLELMKCSEILVDGICEYHKTLVRCPKHCCGICMIDWYREEHV